jgi:hypothetical protein
MDSINKGNVVMGKLIYMQSTIDFILSKHSHRITEIESKGIPEVIELTDDKGNTINKYFKFIIEDTLN